MIEIDTSALESLDGPSDDQLSGVRQVAEELVQLEDDVARLEQKLKDTKELLQKTRIEHLPEAMKAVGLRKFTLDNGIEIDVHPDLNAWIKKADQPDAFSWMEDNGHGSIIKNEFKVPLGKGVPQERTQELVQFLDANEYEFSNTNSIHPGTLKAWAREQLKEGNEIPEAINIFEFEVAKVKRPKAEA